MADILNVSKRGLFLSIKRLLAKEMVAVLEKDEGKTKTEQKKMAGG